MDSIETADRVEMRDFGGLASNIDGEDVQPGMARVQTNMQILQAGAMEPRPGLRAVTFDN